MRANMSGVMKVLTGILGVLAVIACLATVGIIGYSLTGAGNKETTKNTDNQTTEQQVTAVPTTAPTTDPGQNTESAIFKTVRAFWGDPQNLFPPGKAHVSSGGNELIIKKIIRGIPRLFNFRLFTPHDSLKLRIITNDIGKIINQFAFHAPGPLIR